MRVYVYEYLDPVKFLWTFEVIKYKHSQMGPINEFQVLRLMYVSTN